MTFVRPSICLRNAKSTMPAQLRFDVSESETTTLNVFSSMWASIVPVSSAPENRGTWSPDDTVSQQERNLQLSEVQVVSITDCSIVNNVSQDGGSTNRRGFGPIGTMMASTPEVFDSIRHSMQLRPDEGFHCVLPSCRIRRGNAKRANHAQYLPNINTVHRNCTSSRVSNLSRSSLSDDLWC